jgi:photosystem I subunit III
LTICRTAFAPSFQAHRVQAKKPAAARAVVCSAERQEATKQMGTAAAAAALAMVVGFGSVDAAYADIAGLTPCSESKAFAKRKKNEVKGLQKRLKQYEAGSAPALALTATIEKTEKRFDLYAKQGLLCGNDGLPHLIADPGLALRYGHGGDVFVSAIDFVSISSDRKALGFGFFDRYKRPTLRDR